MVQVSRYACQCISDARMGLIELGHTASENVGIEELAGILAERFPSLKVRFYRIRPALTGV